MHAYCWDKHVLQGHKPVFEVGTVDLNGEFKVKESKVEEEVSDKQVPPSIE